MVEPHADDLTLLRLLISGSRHKPRRSTSTMVLALSASVKFSRIARSGAQNIEGRPTVSLEAFFVRRIAPTLPVGAKHPAGEYSLCAAPPRISGWGAAFTPWERDPFSTHCATRRA